MYLQHSADVFLFLILKVDQTFPILSKATLSIFDQMYFHSINYSILSNFFQLYHSIYRFYFEELTELEVLEREATYFDVKDFNYQY